MLWANDGQPETAHVVRAWAGIGAPPWHIDDGQLTSERAEAERAWREVSRATGDDREWTFFTMLGELKKPTGSQIMETLRRRSPLKPTEDGHACAVERARYSFNKTCANPRCNEPAAYPHRIFPRDGEPIAYVSGLCNIHREALETHRSWIRLEDSKFVWLDRVLKPNERVDDCTWWFEAGPLEPQPVPRSDGG